MKKLLSLILVLTLTLTLFTSCGKTEKALTSAELLDLGEKYLLEMDYEQAIVYFNKAIEVEPRNSRAYMGAAEAYVGLGETESAIEILKTALEVFSDDESVTIELLEMLIEIGPTTVEWYLELAQIYIDSGDTDKAIEILQQGLDNVGDANEIETFLSKLLPEELVEEDIEEETDDTNITTVELNIDIPSKATNTYDVTVYNSENGEALTSTVTMKGSEYAGGTLSIMLTGEGSMTVYVMVKSPRTGLQMTFAEYEIDFINGTYNCINYWSTAFSIIDS